MIVCCKCGADCGPGKGISMCLFCTIISDFDAMDRTMDSQSFKEAQDKLLAGLDKQDVEAVLSLPLGNLTEEDLNNSTRHDN